MSILTKFANPGAGVWYDPTFRAVLEDHMTYLRTHEKTSYATPEPIHVVKYRFDFYSLLRALGVEQYLHWVVMRMNNLISPTQDFTHLTHILIPNPATVTQILSHYNTRKKVRGR